MFISSLCFKNVYDMLTAVNILTSFDNRPSKIEVYPDGVPQITFEHSRRDDCVNLAFSLNDFSIGFTWIRKSDLSN